VARYIIRIERPDGCGTLHWDVERPDDMSALDAALDVCRNQKVEVWDGKRRIGAVSLTGAPRLALN
jgi:hypothetical protein